MKKFLKLCLAVAALATMFGFASCSNDSSNDSTAPAATTATKKTVETKSITINGVTFTYTTTDGKVDTSSTVAVADDGTVTITGSDGTSKVTVSKDGKSLTYVSGGTTYTGDMTTVDKTTGGVTLKSEDGKTIEAKATAETKTVDAAPVATPAATGTVSEAKVTVTEVAYTDSQIADKIFKFQNNNNKTNQLEDRYYLFHDGKCYKGDTVEEVKVKVGIIPETKPKTVIKYNDKLYETSKAQRESGEGLFTTWGMDKGESITFKADGTGTLLMKGGSAALTFTNNSGVITMKASFEDKPNTMIGLYDGTYLYEIADKNVLHFVENYTVSN